MQKETYILTSGYKMLICIVFFFVASASKLVVWLQGWELGFEEGDPVERWKVFGGILTLSERRKGKYTVVNTQWCNFYLKTWFFWVLQSKSYIVACSIINFIYSIFNLLTVYLLTFYLYLTFMPIFHKHYLYLIHPMNSVSYLKLLAYLLSMHNISWVLQKCSYFASLFFFKEKLSILK